MFAIGLPRIQEIRTKNELRTHGQPMHKLMLTAVDGMSCVWEVKVGNEK